MRTDSGTRPPSRRPPLTVIVAFVTATMSACTHEPTPLSPSWYVESCKDASQARWADSSSVIFLGQEPFDVTIPVRWDADPHSNRSWQLQLNSLFLVDTLIRRYQDSEDEHHLTLAKDYAVDWALFAESHQWEFKTHDHAVSNRAMRLAALLDWSRRSRQASRAELEILERSARWHHGELSDPAKFTHSNHGLFQMTGLVYLCTLLPDLFDVDACHRHARERLNMLWRQQFDADRIHRENSPAYHVGIASRFLCISEDPVFADVPLPWDRQSAQDAVDNTRYLVHPNGRMAMLGDTKESWMAGLPPVQGDELFPDAGYLILAGDEDSQDNSYLIARTALRNHVHRHADDFSFEWSENGEVILTDAGTYFYDYGNPRRRYITSTRAHNTVEVDGRSFPIDARAAGYGNAVQTHEQSGSTSRAVLEHYFETVGATFRREIVLDKGRALRITDHLSSETEHEYTQWFHLAPEFEVTARDDGTYRATSTRNRLTIVPAAADAVLLVKGQEEPRHQGWFFRSPRERVANVALGMRVVAREAVLETTFILDEETPPIRR